MWSRTLQIFDNSGEPYRFLEILGDLTDFGGGCGGAEGRRRRSSGAWSPPQAGKNEFCSLENAISLRKSHRERDRIICCYNKPPSLIQNIHFREPPSPKKSVRPPLCEDFLYFCEVSEDKIDQNECAEGALIVKRPFPGSKVRNGGPDRCKSTLKFSRNKKTQRNFQEQKSA